MKRSIVLTIAGLGLVAATALAGDGVVRRNAKHVAGRYVVVLQADADLPAVVGSAKGNSEARVPHTYRHGVKGFSVETTEAEAQRLARDPRVDFVEEDGIVEADGSWALDRIDQRLLPLDGSFSANGTGAGVVAYVADTGIMAAHHEFGGRVRAGYSAFGDGVGTGDCNGHGTHVAGLIGGETFGVARAVTLVPVRVLGCDGAGSISTVLAGLEWILMDRVGASNRAVLNMSLSGAPSSALDRGVAALITAGVTVVVAAGNDGVDACRMSPARVNEALTVGASTPDDQRASFSNYGACIDLFAPGFNVPAASTSNLNSYTYKSGTSAAAPLVAGTVAIYLEKYPTASPKVITQTVIAASTPNVLALASIGKGSPNRLLFATAGPLDTSTRSDNQLFIDPSFDFGTTFWSAEICTILNPTGCPPGLDEEYTLQGFTSRTGKSHATLGGHPESTTVTSEAVTIPATASRAELSFYLWIVTKEKGNSADDVLKVQVLDPAGRVLETVATFTNLDECATWELRQVDLTRYRGATVRIAFSAAQDKGPSTWFLVDDAELNVWK